jgi:hypothetical protein
VRTGLPTTSVDSRVKKINSAVVLRSKESHATQSAHDSICRVMLA